MKRKIVALLLAGTFLFSGCGSAAQQNASAPKEESVKQTEESSASDETSDIAAIGDVNVDKGVFDVTVTVPAEFVGETTQEELDASAEESGYKVTLNDDGSATYVMTKKQHKQLMEKCADSINSSISEMVGSEDYPNITDVTANSDFTSYTITTTNSEPDFSETVAVMSLYMMSGMYYAFNGTSIDNVHVDFVNADSGEVISSSDSSDLASDSE